LSKGEVEKKEKKNLGIRENIFGFLLFQIPNEEDLILL
jgi:hypothetical protein